MVLIMRFLKHFLARFKRKEKIINNPQLLFKIRDAFIEVKEQNNRIVGNVYCTSGYNNQSLVAHTIQFVQDCFGQVQGQHPDDKLIDALIAHIKQQQTVFEQSKDDPDGIIAGTLVDVENALKNIATNQACRHNKEVK